MSGGVYQPRYQEEVVEVEEENDGFAAPKLLPATPIMRYARKVVVCNYYGEDDGVSEYASCRTSTSTELSPLSLQT